MRSKPSGRFELGISSRHGLARTVISWRAALILFAVLSLATNVATRYCYASGNDSQTLKAAKSGPLDGKRQHLLNDGLHWSAPVPTFSLFEPAKVSIVVLPATSPVARFHSEDCLYNRPPPAPPTHFTNW